MKNISLSVRLAIAHRLLVSPDCGAFDILILVSPPKSREPNVSQARRLRRASLAKEASYRNLTLRLESAYQHYYQGSARVPCSDPR